MQKKKLQSNRARGEKRITKRAKQGLVSFGTRQNLSVFEVEDQFVLLLYI